MILVDSGVWIDYLAPIPSPPVLALRAIIDGERVHDLLMTDLVLCEVLRGVRDELQARRVERALRTYRMATIGSEALAIDAARNYRKLRAKGITIRSTIDLLIGTFCITHGHLLLHRDRDFDAMEAHLGLRVVRA